MKIGFHVTDTRMDVQNICIFAYADKDKVKANLQMRENEF